MSIQAHDRGRHLLRAAGGCLVLLATALALAGASGASDPPTKPTPPPGDPAIGKRVFGKCVPCHKADGSGGIRLTGNPTPNWRDPKRMADPKFGDDYLRDCMTNGKVKSGMLPVAKVGVKPEEIPHLIAYIRTLSRRK